MARCFGSTGDNVVARNIYLVNRIESMSGVFGDSTVIANRFSKMYVNGFVDVSYGNVLLRSGPNPNHLILQGGDISLNGRLFVSGNVGLGTSNPQFPLAINGGTNLANKQLAISANYAVSTVNDTLGALSFYSNNVGYENARIQSCCNVGGVDNNADLRFFTRMDYVTFLERMRIDRAGYVGIGVTNPQSALDVSGAIRVSGGITPTYSTPPTLSTTSIGYFFGASGNLYPVSNVDIYSVTPPAGVYIFNIDATIGNPNPTGANYASYLYLSKAGTMVTQIGRAWGGVPSSWAETPISLTGFLSVDGTQQVKFYITSNCNVSFNYFAKYMRIA